MSTDTLHAALAAKARAHYSQETAADYRHHDDLGLGAPTHQDYGELLETVSQSFGRPIDILDLGCGTGRYWHHLRNVRTLTGVDISPGMLLEAKRPVCEDAIHFPRTLICDSLDIVEIPDASMDLVYAIGVLGRFMPLDTAMVARVWRMLKPGGVFVVTASDRATYEIKTVKRRLVKLVLPLLPSALQHRIRARICDCSLTEAQMWALFSEWQPVAIYNRRGGGGKHTEWVCQARRPTP